MAIPIMIFNNITIDEEKELFHDLNNLSTKPSRSAIIRLVQSDLLSKLAREIAVENPYLMDYGVEFNKASVHYKRNKNTFLLTSVYDCCKTYLKVGLGSVDVLNENNFYDIKLDISKTFDSIFEVLPQDLNIKGKYILAKGFALRAIFSFVQKQLNENISEELIYDAIRLTDWTESEETWCPHGAVRQKSGSLLFSGNNTGGLTAVQRELQSKLDNLISEQFTLDI